MIKIYEVFLTNEGFDESDTFWLSKEKAIQRIKDLALEYPGFMIGYVEHEIEDSQNAWINYQKGCV